MITLIAVVVAVLPFVVHRLTGEAGGEAARNPHFSQCVGAPTGAASGLEDPAKLDLVRRLVSSAENSSLVWEKQYGYLEYDVEGNPEENRGYTGGLVGFTSKTHDMLLLVRQYTRAKPDNPLARYLPALETVDGTASKAGLGRGFERAWAKAATDEGFREAQRGLASSMYYAPAISAARADGLGALGQYVYVDAMIVHGPGDDPVTFGGIRERALSDATPPGAGSGDITAQKRWLSAFLDARAWAMRQETAHFDLSRVDTQRAFLDAGNLGLMPPLSWTMYGDRFRLDPAGSAACR